MLTESDREIYIKDQYGSLVGKTIKKVRPLTKEECEDFSWEYRYSDGACVFICTDGTAFVPMADPEGNNAGFLEVARVEKVK